MADRTLKLATLGMAVLACVAAGCTTLSSGDFESDFDGGRGGRPVPAGDGDTDEAFLVDDFFENGDAGTLPTAYVIRKGDTLSQISQRFYGTSKHWRRILEANPGIKERQLRIGQEITIPDLDY